jgi:hypothetical protein
MMLTRLRLFSCCMATLLCFPFTSSAYDTPLSDTAVRDAYFIGQRHDESLISFFNRYTRHLPAPKTGPHISSIAFFTPFAQVADYSMRHYSGYSAQQAQIDFRNQTEFVKIIVQIDFTASYSAMIVRPTNSRYASPLGVAMRSYDFYKDFEVQVFRKETQIKPSDSTAEPNYICSEDGGCTITGATLTLEFPADTFSTEDAVVRVIPPEGDEVIAEFDPLTFR